MKTFYQTLLMFFIITLFSGCSTFYTESFKVSKHSKLQIKRNWVRRLSSDKNLRTNALAQNFNPLIRKSGHIIQASSFSGIYEFNKYGRKVWSYPSEVGIAGSGALYKNFIFFGTQNKYIHAYDTINKSILWSTLLIDGAVSTVSEFKNGRIFVLTDTGSLYAIKTADGAVDWKVSHAAKKPLKIYGGAKPILFKKNVIAGFPNGVVSSLNQTTGQILWSIQLEGSQKHEDVDFLSFSEQEFLVAGVFNEAFYRLSLKTGKILWQAYEKPVSAPTSFNQNLYFANADGEFVRLGLKVGNIISRRKIFKGLGGKPLFLKNYIVVTDSKGPIRLIENETGEILADYDLISASSANLSLNKTSNKFYVLSDKGYLYSFGITN